MVYRWICEPIKYKPTKQHFGSNLYICVKAVQWPVWAWPWLRIYSQEESWKKIKSDRYLVSFPASNTFGRINKFTFFLVIPFSLFLSLFLTWHVVLHSIFRLLLIGQKQKKNRRCVRFFHLRRILCFSFICIFFDHILYAKKCGDFRFACSWNYHLLNDGIDVLLLFANAMRTVNLIHNTPAVCVCVFDELLTLTRAHQNSDGIITTTLSLKEKYIPLTSAFRDFWESSAICQCSF